MMQKQAACQLWSRR